MSKYDIRDAYKLKVFMQEIQLIIDKYGAMNVWTLQEVPEAIKTAIEFIAEMVEKKV